MILERREGDAGPCLRVTTQPDHAVFAAEVLKLWRADGLPENPRRAAILFAVREHDNGWREADSAPRVHPEHRRPYNFMEIPTGLRTEIWLRGVDRFREAQPYASLLVAEHAARLHRDHRSHDEWRTFFEALDERRQELTEECFADPVELDADYRFLELADLISLAVCSGWTGPMERGGLSFEVKGSDLYMDPLPLAGATTFRLRCRTIPDRPYAGEADLGGELATSRWQDRQIRVRGPA